MHHIYSYPTIYALGHKAVTELLCGKVLIEEKVDGSQFSMQRLNGELACRSKGQDLIVEAPEKMFTKAVETASALPLTDGWIYRCEYLQSPKHNTLAYARHPAKHLVLYDVETGIQSYLSPAEKYQEAARLGLECVPVYFEGTVLSLEQVQAMLDRDSILGGSKIEGVVIKNYALFMPDKKVAMAKYVCADFQEKNAKEWKRSNPTQQDIVQSIIASLRTDARWNKAVQHLRESGNITDSPKDIGPLIKEARADILKEEKEWIAEQLANHFIPQIIRGSIAGLPEWYKDKLAKSSFTEETLVR